MLEYRRDVQPYRWCATSDAAGAAKNTPRADRCLSRFRAPRSPAQKPRATPRESARDCVRTRPKMVLAISRGVLRAAEKRHQIVLARHGVLITQLDQLATERFFKQQIRQQI